MGVWFYFKKCRKAPATSEGAADDEHAEPKESERGLTVKEAAPKQLICDLQSNEQLEAKDYRSEKSATGSEKISAQAELPPNDLHNFSIGDDPQNEAFS